MSNTFTPRKKKPQKIELTSEMKSVRIDEKTIILVSKSISDEEARERYSERHKITPKPHLIAQRPMTMDEAIQEKPIGSLEDIEQIEKINEVNGY